MDSIFQFLTWLDGVFWGYFAFVLVMILGLSLSIRARGYQLRSLPSSVQIFFQSAKPIESERGVHPLKVFFASVGGMIGIGNIVGIVTAIQIGGPGALFWVWVAAIIGTIIKYSEIFLGLKYRVSNERGSFDGGPMYFLQKAFKNRWIPVLIAVLLCIYGVEIYQFAVITDSLSVNFNLNRYFIIAGLLFLVYYAGIGGVKRIGGICCNIMPIFMVVYLSMSIWIIVQEIAILPAILKNVMISAFTGHAAVGGFVGSSAILGIQHGISRAVYSADIGIGYDSIIQSESSTKEPTKQAKLAILGVFIDNLVCTMSILVVLLTGVWSVTEPIEASRLVQEALSRYFPFMHIFMPLFLFIVGYTTMIAYFCVGIKCARFLSPQYGVSIYLVYGVFAWVLFSFVDQTKALLMMSIAGALLLMINLTGIYTLRKEIDYPVGKGLDSPVPPCYRNRVNSLYFPSSGFPATGGPNLFTP